MPIFAFQNSTIAEHPPWWVARDVEWGTHDGTIRFPYALIFGSRDPMFVAGCHARQQLIELHAVLLHTATTIAGGGPVARFVQGRWAMEPGDGADRDVVARLLWLSRTSSSQHEVWKTRWRFNAPELISYAAAVLDRAITATVNDPEVPMPTEAAISFALKKASTPTLSMLAQVLANSYAVNARQHADHETDSALLDVIQGILRSRACRQVATATTPTPPSV